MGVEKTCDIIIPTIGPLEMIESCINALLVNTRVPVRVIIINNGVSFLCDYLRSLKKTDLIDYTIITLLYDNGSTYKYNLINRCK